MGKGNIKLDVTAIATVIVTALLSWQISAAVSKERIDTHIGNDYVHKDISSLEETFVRKDVQAEQLKAILERLNRISEEMGIETEAP